MTDLGLSQRFDIKRVSRIWRINSEAFAIIVAIIKAYAHLVSAIARSELKFCRKCVSAAPFLHRRRFGHLIAITILRKEFDISVITQCLHKTLRFPFRRYLIIMGEIHCLELAIVCEVPALYTSNTCIFVAIRAVFHLIALILKVILSRHAKVNAPNREKLERTVASWAVIARRRQVLSH